jgi:hypothetical protein
MRANQHFSLPMESLICITSRLGKFAEFVNCSDGLAANGWLQTLSTPFLGG